MRRTVTFTDGSVLDNRAEVLALYFNAEYNVVCYVVQIVSSTNPAMIGQYVMVTIKDNSPSSPDAIGFAGYFTLEESMAYASSFAFIENPFMDITSGNFKIV